MIIGQIIDGGKLECDLPTLVDEPVVVAIADFILQRPSIVSK